MQLKTLALGLAFPVWIAAVTPAADKPVADSKPAAAPTAAATKDEKSMFGEPLVVNGRRVTDDEIKLALIYGPCRLMLDMHKIGLIIEDEITRQIQERSEAEVAAKEKEKAFDDAAARAKAKAAAATRLSSLLHEKYRVKDEEFEAEYQYTVDDFHKTYPVLDIGAEICRAFRSVDWFREQLRQTMYFDHVFLPVNPEEWPTTTIEAMRADPGGGDLLIQDAKDSYIARLKAAEKNDGKLPREDSLYMTILRQISRDAMMNLMTIKTAPDGIDPKLALWGDANGDGKPEVSVTIEELWNVVQDTVTETEIAEAKQWYVTSLATKDRLAKDGALLSPEDCRKALEDLTRAFEGGTVTLEQMATKTYYFPSVEAFVQYYCMKEGYEKMIAPKLENGPGGELSQTLREYFDRANRVMGLGMIDCEVILVSAQDIPRFRWKKDGWSWARKAAQDLRAQIDENARQFNEQRAKKAEAQAAGKEFKPEKEAQDPYRYWSQMVDDHSEYWDPPPPEGPGKKASDVGYKKKGRFGAKYRNDLVNYVGETPYNEWVSGECITDRMFFDQAENSVAGPYKGPLGYYITRLNRRTPPSRPLNLAEPKHMELLKDDYVRWSFIQYSKEAVAQAKTQGWKPL